MTLQQFLLDVRLARHRQNRRQPVQVRNDFIGNVPGLIFPGNGPSRERGRPFPVRVLFVAERRHRRIRPGVHVRTIVGAVHDKRIVTDAQLVDLVQHRADVLVMVDHRVGILAHPTSRLPEAFRLDVRPEVHVSEVDPHKEWLVGLGLSLDEIGGAIGDIVVDRFHALCGSADRCLRSSAVAKMNAARRAGHTSCGTRDPSDSPRCSGSSSAFRW